MSGIIAKGGPVMYPLIACSILSLGVIMERMTFWLSYSRGKRRKRVGKEMTRFLPVLDTMVTLSPLLGILGTVTGVIQSFDLLGGGGRDLTAVSSGIAQALITTAAGLIIAMFSLVSYNYFVHRSEAIEAAVEDEGRGSR